jgi:hypothetical protein
MKRLSLKATSLILALVLALSLSVTAFADDNAASMTRAEVTQEVIKNMGLAAQAEASAKDASAFKDVAEGSKFEGAINLACSKGIVNGVSARRSRYAVGSGRDDPAQHRSGQGAAEGLARGL